MPESVHQARLTRLRTSLAEATLQAALISRPQHVFYLTGIMPGASPTFLIILPDSVLAVAPAPLADFETIPYTDYDIHSGWNIAENAAHALTTAFSGRALGGSVGIELDHLPALYLRAIERLIGEAHPLSTLLWALRRVKDSTEIDQIEMNLRVNDSIFNAMYSVLAPGVVDFTVWNVMDHLLTEKAGFPFTLEADLGIGERGSNPDAKPNSVIIQPGDTVFIDLYSAAHGYYADTTRIFTIGEPTPRQRQLHDLLESAIVAGEARLLPGTAANQVDAAVRGTLEQAGYGDNFPHHSGHAYGLFQQERPYFIPAETSPLEAGMVVTLEPGVYLPGWGGMRLESSYLIEPNGARRLETFSRALVSIR